MLGAKFINASTCTIVLQRAMQVMSTWGGENVFKRSPFLQILHFLGRAFILSDLFAGAEEEVEANCVARTHYRVALPIRNTSFGRARANNKHGRRGGCLISDLRGRPAHVFPIILRIFIDFGFYRQKREKAGLLSIKKIDKIDKSIFCL